MEPIELEQRKIFFKVLERDLGFLEGCLTSSMLSNLRAESLLHLKHHLFLKCQGPPNRVTSVQTEGLSRILMSLLKPLIVGYLAVELWPPGEKWLLGHGWYS